MTLPNMSSIAHMQRQTERVQHNVKALSFLREMADHLKTPEKAQYYLNSMEFQIKHGSGTDEGRAADPILRKAVLSMLPLIVGHAIAAAEAGNKEALATIGQLAETLKES